MSPEELEIGRRLLKSATPAPWECNGGGGAAGGDTWDSVCATDPGHGTYRIDDDGRPVLTPSSGESIANVRAIHGSAANRKLILWLVNNADALIRAAEQKP